MCRSTSVIVHFGDQSPTVRLANTLVGFGTQVVCVANDLSGRPADLSAAIEWFVPPRNLGYGAAFAAAVDHRTCQAFVLLNNDVVITAHTFQRCLDALSDQPDVGILGPVLRHEDGSLQSGAARLSRWRRAPCVLIEPGARGVDCEWVTGAVMFIRGEVARDVGMDGSFFLGAEDVDICVRARLAGWRVQCRGDATAVHHGSRVITGPRWTYYTVRNRVWLVRAHFGLASAVISWVSLAVRTPRVLVADLVKRRTTLSFRLSVMGLVHALRAKPSMGEGPLAGEPLPARVMSW